ncbi:MULTISPECIES: SAF domain-containing protein [unclassified Nonomuraea]|uniref:SAF domain-containing protein n=1 Tax=unclassified Nonomuraea TaxID=2593643 RepID=UPI0033FD425D
MARETTSDASGQLSVGEPPPTRAPKLLSQPRQRRRSSLVFGTLVVAGGAFLTVQTVMRLNDREPVLVVTQDVALGQPFTAQNISTAMMGADQAVAAVGSHELQRVIGKRAAVDLMKGVLVQSRMVTDQVTPLADQQLIPIAVKPSRLPARGLQPGDRLLVVPASDAQTVPDDVKASSGGVEAVVDQVKGPDNDGLMVVDVLVPSHEGPRLAALASDGNIAMALTPRRP